MALAAPSDLVLTTRFGYARLVGPIRFVLSLALLIGFGVIPQVAKAQFGYFQDVSRLTMDRPIGTARIQGMGGASQAIGADLSNLATNPAGIGWYQHGELVAAPAVTINAANGKYLGQSVNDSKSNLNFSNVGFVFASHPPSNSASVLRGGAFAIGINRQADFQTSVSWAGTSSGVSTDALGNLSAVANGLVHNYLDLARSNGIGINIIKAPQLFPDQQQVRSGYSVFMLDTTTTGGLFTTFLPPADFAQKMTINTSGSRMSIDIGGGANLLDRITFGLSAGMGLYNYTEARNYTETFDKIYYDGANPIKNDSTYLGSSYTLEDQVTTRGASFNLRVGVQALLTKTLRFGASVQLPSVYGMYQGYETKLSANYRNVTQTITRNGIQRTQPLPTDPFRGPVEVPDVYYLVTTPWKFSSGLAYVNRKFGIVSADVDYIDYATASISSPDFNAAGDNQAIKTVYNKVVNVRLGAELRYDNWRGRLGFGQYGNPLSDKVELGYFFSKGTQYYSVGGGYRDSDFFMDFALTYNRNQQRYTAHTYTLPADITQHLWNLQTTFGYYF